MLKKNLNTLLGIIVRAGMKRGKLEEEPEIALGFNPLWSMSDSEKADVGQKDAQAQHTRAQTAQLYVDLGALDPAEVRKVLAAKEEFSVEEMLDGMPEEDLWGGEYPEGDPAPFDGESDISTIEGVKRRFERRRQSHGRIPGDARGDSGSASGIGVIVVKDGRILGGIRSDNGQCCGPGGHIEDGETPAAAAIRETQEEFGITPTSLRFLGQLEGLGEEYGNPYIYLCTEYEGEMGAQSDDNDEIILGGWIRPEDVEHESFPELFPPFRESLKLLQSPGSTYTNQLTKEGHSDRIGKRENIDSGDKTEWVTINGTPVPLDDDGDLGGSIGAKIEETSQGRPPGSTFGEPSPMTKLGRIDPTPENIARTLKEYENELIGLDHEVAIVITANGEVLRFDGDEKSVNTAELGEKRKGASDFHNHTDSQTKYSFSELDAGYFIENKFAQCKSGDSRYSYTMTRTESTISASQEEVKNEFEKIYNNKVLKLSYDGLIDIDYNGYHETMVLIADEYKFDYEREDRNGGR